MQRVGQNSGKDMRINVNKNTRLQREVQPVEASNNSIPEWNHNRVRKNFSGEEQVEQDGENIPQERGGQPRRQNSSADGQNGGSSNEKAAVVLLAENAGY